MTSDIAFPKSARLLTSEQYSQVFDTVDERVSSRYFLFLVHTQVGSNELKLGHGKLGIIVAKKNIRHAVQRNRIKRLLRESFRHKRSSLPNIDIVVLAKKGADALDNEQLASELQYLWKKLTRKLNKTADSKGSKR